MERKHTGPRVSFADSAHPEESDSKLSVDGTPDNKSVSFGLVKQGGVYSLNVLTLPGEDIAIVAPLSDQLNVRTTRNKADGQQDVVACLVASHPGFIEDNFSLLIGSRKIEIQITAKIMPAGKGTPALKDDVHNLGKLETEETDFE